MAHEPQRMDFDHFAANIQQVFEQVRDRNQPILVDRDGETYHVEKLAPQDIWEGYNPVKVQKALMASAGALHGVDIEELLSDLDAQREQGPGRFD